MGESVFQQFIFKLNNEGLTWAAERLAQFRNLLHAGEKLKTSSVVQPITDIASS